MTPIYAKVLAAASAVALTLTLTGCVNEDSPCDIPADNDGMAIKFTLVTRNGLGGRMQAPTSSPSRADDDCNADSPGTAAENYIDMADCELILFDGDKRLLRRIYPEKATSAADSYTAQVEITDAYFTDKVRNGEDVSFYIMAVANSSSLSGQQLALTPGQSITDLAAQQRTFKQPTGIWTPGTDKYIPMAGFRRFTVTAAALKASSYDVPVVISTEDAANGVIEGGSILMLRAMAKIEIVDKIDIIDKYIDDEDDEDSNRPSITGATLQGFFEKGAILPIVGGNPSSSEGEILWNQNHSGQVIAPTIPSSSGYSKTGTNSSSITFQLDDDAKDNRSDNCRVYSGYIVEYNAASRPTSGTGGTPSGPTVTVTIKSPNAEASSPKPFAIKLGTYNKNGKFQEEIPFLLRNHIYRYEITGITQAATLNINYTVCPWSTYDVDIPTFE